MTREISAPVAAASEAEVIRAAILVYLDFAGGVVRASSLPYELSYDADEDSIVETFDGLGTFGSLSVVQETTELRANTITLNLSGVAPEMLAIALGEDYQGRAAKAWFVTFDEDHQPTGAVVIVSEKMDTMQITRGDTGTIELTLQNAAADLERARLLRFTDEDQQHLYPGDRGLEYTSIAAAREVLWGTTKPGSWGNGTNNGGA